MDMLALSSAVLADLLYERPGDYLLESKGAKTIQSSNGDTINPYSA